MVWKQGINALESHINENYITKLYTRIFLIGCSQWHCIATRVQNERKALYSLIHLPNKQVPHHVANRKWLWTPPASKSTLALAGATSREQKQSHSHLISFHLNSHLFFTPKKKKKNNSLSLHRWEDAAWGTIQYHQQPSKTPSPKNSTSHP